ncbi:UNVERIFIED_CONTAM: hypothetical protein FKN15_052471 [Acipenser sinensis]
MPGTVRRWNYPPPLCIARCGGTLFEMSGVILSPGFPGNYPSNLDCTWKILLPVGYGEFQSISLPLYCYHYSYMILRKHGITPNRGPQWWQVQMRKYKRDGPGENYAQLGVFSGNTALQSAYSSFNQVLIKLHSDFSTGGFFVLNFHGDVVKYKCFPGFTLVGSDQLTCKLNTYLQFEGTLNSCEAQCPANEVRTESSGVILSPGYPGLYPNSQTCSWTVKVEFGYNISIYVEMFQSEKQFDELEIFDGPTGQSPLLVALSGNHTGQLNFTSKTNVLYLRWSTDHATNKKGFKIRYSG